MSSFNGNMGFLPGGSLRRGQRRMQSTNRPVVTYVGEQPTYVDTSPQQQQQPAPQQQSPVQQPSAPTAPARMVSSADWNRKQAATYQRSAQISNIANRATANAMAMANPATANKGHVRAAVEGRNLRNDMQAADMGFGQNYTQQRQFATNEDQRAGDAAMQKNLESDAGIRYADQRTRGAQLQNDDFVAGGNYRRGMESRGLAGADQDLINSRDANGRENDVTGENLRGAVQKRTQDAEIWPTRRKAMETQADQSGQAGDLALQQGAAQLERYKAMMSPEDFAELQGQIDSLKSERDKYMKMAQGSLDSQNRNMTDTERDERYDQRKDQSNQPGGTPPPAAPTASPAAPSPPPPVAMPGGGMGWGRRLAGAVNPIAAAVNSTEDVMNYFGGPEPVNTQASSQVSAPVAPSAPAQRTQSAGISQQEANRLKSAGRLPKQFTMNGQTYISHDGRNASPAGA